MCQAILTVTGKVVPRRTISRLSIAEMNSSVEKKKRDKFDDVIRKILGDSTSIVVTPPEDEVSYEYVIGDSDLYQAYPDDDPLDDEGVAMFERPLTDALIHAEVILPQGEELKPAKVKGRATTLDGDIIGVYDPDPLLNTILYDVEFSDGQIRQYAANTIAENMYSQVDEEGYSNTRIESIIDNKRTSDAVTIHRK